MFAYTPYHVNWFKEAGRWHGGKSGIRAGDIVFFNWDGGVVDHVGVVEKVLSGGRVQTIEGNTSNACLRRIRTGSIAGYGRPNYTAQPGEDDDMPTYVSVDKSTKSRQQALDSGKWQTVYFDLNNSAGADKHHAKGDYPSLVKGPAEYAGHISLRITGVPAGAEGQVRTIEVDKDGHALEWENPVEFVGSSGDTFTTLPATGSVGADRLLRVEVVHFGAADARPVVAGGKVRLQVWER